MNLAKGVVVFCCLFYNVSGLEPMTFMAIGTAVFAGIYTTLNSYERCNSKWINLNTKALKRDLHKRLYGQHLVSKIIIRQLKSHTQNKASKALLLSFHGGTGTGKNYVSKIIADSMYSQGMKSKYVHLISATKEFPLKQNVPEYKIKLQNLIESSVRNCARSMFIFDEIDKMPPGVLDVLVPYLDFYEKLDGVDYRNAIFIFLSNTAGTEINKHAMARIRDDVTMKDMEEIIKNALTTGSGTGDLYHSPLIYKHLITAYVPFLPLEEMHVRMCIRDYLVENNYYEDPDEIPDNQLGRISYELQYHPYDKKRFSVTGCKRIPEKVAYVMDDDQ